MDSDVLNWIDDRVKERIFASRTYAFEYAVRQLMEE
jgi:metal-responsive CopG/Arc/MetJ family transcriptional regulator